MPIAYEQVLRPRIRTVRLTKSLEFHGFSLWVRIVIMDNVHSECLNEHDFKWKFQFIHISDHRAASYVSSMVNISVDRGTNSPHFSDFPARETKREGERERESRRKRSSEID